MTTKKTPSAKAGNTRTANATKPVDWSQLVAADIMQRDVVTVTDTMRLSEVGRTFSEQRISGAPVTDEAGNIIGVVSARDLIDRYCQEPDSHQARGPSFYGLSSDELDDDFEDLTAPAVAADSEDTAADVMTAELFSVPPTAPLRQLAKEMVRHAIHRILVVENSRTVGIVSTMDVLRALAR